MSKSEQNNRGGCLRANGRCVLDVERATQRAWLFGQVDVAEGDSLLTSNR